MHSISISSLSYASQSLSEAEAAVEAAQAKASAALTRENAAIENLAELEGAAESLAAKDAELKRTKVRRKTDFYFPPSFLLLVLFFFPFPLKDVFAFSLLRFLCPLTTNTPLKDHAAALEADLEKERSTRDAALARVVAAEANVTVAEQAMTRAAGGATALAAAEATAAAAIAAQKMAQSAAEAAQEQAHARAFDADKVLRRMVATSPHACLPAPPRR